MCYGRGGVEPTVTDANLVLGYLNPTSFCGGTMRLDVEGAHAAIRERVARPLGLPVVAAAEGIFRLVNANMANAVRKISAGRGVDPRPLTLVVFGGNGPVHAGMQAAELGIRRIFVPKLSPAFSALGLLLTDHVIDDMRSYISPVGRVDAARVNALFAEMETAARAALTATNGRRAGRLRFERLAALCYPGQTFDMAVPLAGRGGPVTARVLADTVERFHRMHEELHTYASRDQEPILRGVRLKAVAGEEKPSLPRLPRKARGNPRIGARKAFFRGRFITTPVYDRHPHDVGAGDPRTGDRRGAVHDDRRVPGAAGDGGCVRELRDRAGTRLVGLRLGRWCARRGAGAAAPRGSLGAPGSALASRSNAGGPGTHALLVALAPAPRRGIQPEPH